MLKIVYPICCGIDVHKSFVVACIASTDGRGVTTYKSKRFSTFTKGLKELSAWLFYYKCTDVCMESTGKYWIPVYNILEHSCKIVLAHPKYVKSIPGKKTDKKDAQWIADIFKHDLVIGSFIPSFHIRQLRDLMRYRSKLTNYSTGETNRARNCLTVSNLKLDDVFSDIFGKSAGAIIDRILENPNEPFDVEPFVSKKCKAPIEAIQAAVDGEMCSEQVQKLQIIRSHLNDLGKAKAYLDSVILTLAEKFQPQVNLVSTVPGIKSFSAIAIIAEINVDMSVFISAKHLCSWAGLSPQNNSSAGKKKTTRISRAGAYIKPLLVQCANAVVRSDKHPEIRNRYLKLKKRRGHKRAIIAIARMLLVAIYNILKKNESYNADLYKKSDVPPKTTDMSVDSAIRVLQSKGYAVSPPS
jgi:transposase